MSSVSIGMDAEGAPETASSPTRFGSPVDKTVVAAFDVDMTLTNRDCVIPFLRRLWSWKKTPRLVVYGAPLVWAGLRRDRDRVKALATRVVMKGLDREHLDRHGATFASEIAAKWLRSDTLRRLQWHHQQGHHVVLVSASYSSYLRHLGSYLECAEVLSCEVDFDDRGRCTGELIDGNCRGREKERRLKSWMQAQGLDAASTYAYGDSAGDDHLLAMATWPTRIGSELLSEVPHGQKIQMPATTLPTPESSAQ